VSSPHESLLPGYQELHSTSDLARTTSELGRVKGELELIRADLAAKTKECQNLRSQVDGLQAFTASLPSAQVPLTISGDPILGNTLHIVGAGPIPTSTHTQWYRLTGDGEMQSIAGANRVQYAPEPRDVGFTLLCSLAPQEGGAALTAYSSGPIQAGEGLTTYVNALVTKGQGEFGVVIVQLNGKSEDKKVVHQLEVLRNRLKIKHKGKTKYKENYTLQMQVCGARGGGDAAAQGLFLALDPSQVFMLACESARERNAAIMLIRKFAEECAVNLVGPEESVPKLENTGPGKTAASGNRV